MIGPAFLYSRTGSEMPSWSHCRNDALKLQAQKWQRQRGPLELVLFVTGTRASVVPASSSLRAALKIVSRPDRLGPGLAPFESVQNHVY